MTGREEATGGSRISHWRASLWAELLIALLSAALTALFGSRSFMRIPAGLWLVLFGVNLAAALLIAWGVMSRIERPRGIARMKGGARG